MMPKLWGAAMSQAGLTVLISPITGTYHELDYALFYMNIRNNARLRTQAHLASLLRPSS
ncbi:MAG: hypothetical protein AAF525_22065 [Pseudomonadota bacterium]